MIQWTPHLHSWDGNLWIDHDPDRLGLLVTTGDSGHAFRFTPLLGKLIADALERMFASRARGEVKLDKTRFSESKGPSEFFQELGGLSASAERRLGDRISLP